MNDIGQSTDLRSDYQIALHYIVIHHFCFGFRKPHINIRSSISSDPNNNQTNNMLILVCIEPVSGSFLFLLVSLLAFFFCSFLSLFQCGLFIGCTRNDPIRFECVTFPLYNNICHAKQNSN